MGGFVTGGSRAVTEPLLTLTEQVETASQIARAISLPVVADAGAGFGEPLTLASITGFAMSSAGVYLVTANSGPRKS